MKDMVSFDRQVRLDSREIAKLTGKEHRNVCRDIVEQLGRLEGGVARFEHTYQNEQNDQKYKCFLLPKREALILVSGYSVELRAKIIDRLQELESGSHTLPTSFAEALQLAANQAREIEALTPRAAVADKISSSVNMVNVGTFAKSVGLGPIKIFGVLDRLKIMFRDCGDWVPFQQYIDLGYFKTIVNPILQGNKVVNHTTTYVTGKGEVWLTKKIMEAL